ncbi:MULTISPECIES: PD-(D/E)XK motif protein [unclassified Cryobacterium]|uniref:PD-(D/E)XK motif protein n=1 Tax=unclassified Cryobacterium TaxID=2649013 RepID=UPI00106B89E6|nr:MULTISPECIES: PD-(D/E)XK motif protein [unclassified Cryobacterium]TFB96267.1 PD-(D/E)XK motif protein [Cryobacterium sp. MDB2-A-1]TFC12552.1 PD-(D/E)XK motif protein [Cryobacterium sp. MDB2-A-2]
MTNYEYALELIASVPRAEDAGIRDVKWMTDAHVVGVARDTDGRVEVFLRGTELHPSSAIVRDVIEFRVVHRDGQPSFQANRLHFPALSHFDQVAAFICTELLRGDADASLPRAFTQTEPIIELAIERLILSNQAILGLAGELLLIDALCRSAQDTQVADIIAGWDGWKRSSRDLVLGVTGIEVKTTTGPTSSHFVEGVHQVELDDGFGGGTPEDRLILVSIGLEPNAEGGNAFTIPQLVDRILARMFAAGLRDSEAEKFLFHVSEYGANLGGGYDHHVQASDVAYATGFVTSFFRAYDMSDPNIEVLRRQDIAARSHTDIGSVTFRVDLPVSASADNPINGANQVAEAIIG